MPVKVCTVHCTMYRYAVTVCFIGCPYISQFFFSYITESIPKTDLYTNQTKDFVPLFSLYDKTATFS
jgi:hypothetical protein